MDYDTLDILFHSRNTLLKILAARGFNTKPFEKFGPFEIGVMAAAGNAAFRMDLERSTEAAIDTGMTKCRVEFSPRIKNRLPGFMNGLTDAEENPDAVGPDTELIVLTLDPIVEAFNTMAFLTFSKGIRVSFFQVDTLVNNPLEHSLVPKHERVPNSEHTAFLKSIRATSKTVLPLIRFHEDMIARLMCLVPGDIVKITRASPSAGEYISYRVCAP